MGLSSLKSSLKKPGFLSKLVVPLTLTALLLPVFRFLLQGDALPCTHDNIFHSYRIVAMREMLRHGWLFSRWVPNLALGYGYPFFTYREPLPYLLGEALYAVGIPLPVVLGGLYAASLLAGAWGVYVLGRDLFGLRAAWVAAVAYGLAPYVLMDALRRGNMPESIGLALVPWLFVVMRRLVLYRGRGRFVVAVSLLAALFLSHNISSLLLAPFLGLYVITLSLIHRDRDGWPYALGAVSVAVLLTAWFWLPALTEQGAVQLHLSRSTRNNDFHYNFASWDEMLLTVPAPHDPAFVNPPMRVTLGVGRAALALIGGVLGLWRARDRERRWLVALLLVAGLFYLWMATPGSVRFWESVPLLSFVQFPWRFVGRALLPASLLAGLAVEAAFGDSRTGDLSVPPSQFSEEVGGAAAVEVRHRSSRSATIAARSNRHALLPTLAALVCVAGLTGLSWPESYPPKGMCGVGRYPDLTALYAREQSGWMGMDPESSYFPIWVEEHPDDTALADAFIQGDLPERFDVSALPKGADLVDATYRPLSADIVIRTPEAFRARWLGFYYPGWQIRVDGEPVAIAPEDDTGLIAFDVPAGEHSIRVRFGLTPARALGTWLAAAGALATGGLLFARGLRSLPTTSPAVSGAGSVGGKRLAMAMLGFSLVALAVRQGLPGSVSTFWSRSRLVTGDLPEVTEEIDQPYVDGLRLLGYSIGAEQLRGDEELTVSLLWQADRRPSRDYRTVVLLRGPDGELWSPAGTARPRGYEAPPASGSWDAGAYVFEPHVVRLKPGSPPGVYEVVVAIFDEDTLAPLAPLDDEGRPVGTDLVIGTVDVLRPQVVPDLTLFGVPPLPTPAACGSIRLRAFSLDRETGTPGGLLAISWIWDAVATPVEDLTPNVSLVGPSGDAIRQWKLPAAADWWPTKAWLAGDRWAGQHVVRLPGDLDGGVYELRAHLAGCAGVLAVESLEVTAPERAWEAPDGLDADDVVFGGEVALAGHALAPAIPSAGETLDVTLAWQATAPMETAYRIFVHLIAEDGSIVDQDDGEPLNWSRPTTGWAVGEVVVERRRVTIPADAEGERYMLRVGVYDPDGTRLITLGDGTDGYVLDTLAID